MNPRASSPEYCHQLSTVTHENGKLRVFRMSYGGNGDASNIQGGVMSNRVRTFERQETVGGDFIRFHAIVSAPFVVLRLGCGRKCRCFAFILNLFVRFHESRLMVLVVALQQFLAHRNELAQCAFHFLVLFWMVDPNVDLQGDRLYATVITELTLVRFDKGMPHHMLPQDTRITGIERTHLTLQRLFSCN